MKNIEKNILKNTKKNEKTIKHRENGKLKNNVIR